MVELLSPAGNFEKMRSALNYGADAVYLAGNVFGMRSAADNFTNDELYEAVEYAHARGKRFILRLTQCHTSMNTVFFGNISPRLKPAPLTK